MPSSLECIITGNPLPELIWLFNDRKILPGDAYERQSDSLNAHTVRHRLIISAKQKKLGVYKAQAQNTFGHSISTCQVKKSTHSIDQQKKAAFQEAELQAPAPQRRRSSVTPAAAPVPPVIVQGLTSVQADLGSPCSLTCKSKHDVEQQWLKDGQPIGGAQSKDANILTKTDRSQDGNSHVLNIKQFKQENSGNYELILKNPVGQVTSQGRLDMKGVPPTFSLEPKATAVVKGKQAEFNCRVDGSPKPQVCFTFDAAAIRRYEFLSFRSNGFSKVNCYARLESFLFSKNVVFPFFELIMSPKRRREQSNVS